MAFRASYITDANSSIPFSDDPERPLLHDPLVEEQPDGQHLELHHELKLSASRFQNAPTYKLCTSIGPPPALPPPQPAEQQLSALPQILPTRIKQIRQDSVRGQISPRRLQPNIGPPPDRLPPLPSDKNSPSLHLPAYEAPRGPAETVSTKQRHMTGEELSAACLQKTGQCRDSKSSSVTRFYDAYLISHSLENDAVSQADLNTSSSHHAVSDVSVHAKSRIIASAPIDCLSIHTKIASPSPVFAAQPSEQNGFEAQAEAQSFLEEVKPQTGFFLDRYDNPNQQKPSVKQPTVRPSRIYGQPEKRLGHTSEGWSVCSTGGSELKDTSGDHERSRTIQPHNCVSNFCSVLSSSHAYRLSKISKIPLSSNIETDLVPLLSQSPSEREIEMVEIPQLRSSSLPPGIDDRQHRASDTATWTTIQSQDLSSHNTTNALPSSTLFGLNAFPNTPRVIVQPTDDYMSILKRYARAIEGESGPAISAFLRESAYLESREDNPHKYYSLRMVDGRVVKICPAQSLNTALRLAGMAPVLTVEDASRITGYRFVKLPSPDAMI